jgi:hypothetical protein
VEGLKRGDGETMKRWEKIETENRRWGETVN